MVLSYTYKSNIESVAFGVQATNNITCTSDRQSLGEARQVVGGQMRQCRALNLTWGLQQATSRLHEHTLCCWLAHARAVALTIA